MDTRIKKLTHIRNSIAQYVQDWYDSLDLKNCVEFGVNNLKIILNEFFERKEYLEHHLTIVEQLQCKEIKIMTGGRISTLSTNCIKMKESKIRNYLPT